MNDEPLFSMVNIFQLLFLYIDLFIVIFQSSSDVKSVIFSPVVL